ncbi:MAG: hypothetical protein WCD24_06245, partial [Serratia inhibens]|uniref:hypothetical protein n=1 Tax=Serratia inhibens TaxID=2338073 RepID=UPI003C7DB9EE
CLDPLVLVMEGCILTDRHKKTPAFSQGHQCLPVTFPAVMLWRKRPSNTPTLRSLSTTFSQQKKRLNQCRY